MEGGAHESGETGSLHVVASAITGGHFVSVQIEGADVIAVGITRPRCRPPEVQ